MNFNCLVTIIATSSLISFEGLNFYCDKITQHTIYSMHILLFIHLILIRVMFKIVVEFYEFYYSTIQ